MMPLLNHADIAWLKVQFHWHRLIWLMFVCWPCAFLYGLAAALNDPNDPVFHHIFLYFLALAFLLAWCDPWVKEEFQRTLPLPRRRAIFLLVLSQGVVIAVFAILPFLIFWGQVYQIGQRSVLLVCDVTVAAIFSAAALHAAAIPQRSLWGRSSRPLDVAAAKSFPIAAVSVFAPKLEAFSSLAICLALLALDEVFGLLSQRQRFRPSVRMERALSPGKMRMSMPRHQWRWLLGCAVPITLCLWVLCLLAVIGTYDNPLPAAGLTLPVFVLGLLCTVLAPGLLGPWVDAERISDCSVFVRTLPICRPWALRLHLIRGGLVCLALVGSLLLLALVSSHLCPLASESVAESVRLWALVFISGTCLGAVVLFIGVRLDSRGKREIPDILWILIMLFFVGSTAGAAFLGGRLWALTVCMIAWAILAWLIIPDIDWEREA